MIQTSGVIICLGYILGLLFTAIPWGGFWVLGLGVIGAIFFGRRRLNIRKYFQIKENSQTKAKTAPPVVPTTPHARVWLITGVVGLLASFYFQVRVPTPEANDISQFVSSENGNNQEQLFIVRGEVLSTPRLTRSGRGQLWLRDFQEIKYTASQNDNHYNEGGQGFPFATLDLPKYT